MRLTTLLVALAVAVSSLAGCRSKPAPPALDRVMADLLGDDVPKRGQARLELIRRGDEGVPRLGALLREGRLPQRRLAANVLWALGSHARGAAPELAVALRDPDPDLRLDAAMAFESMGQAAAAAVPALVGALRDRDNRVRQAACRALGAIGPPASEALPALRHAIQRASWPEAEEAVRRIQGAP